MNEEAISLFSFAHYTYSRSDHDRYDDEEGGYSVVERARPAIVIQKSYRQHLQRRSRNDADEESVSSLLGFETSLQRQQQSPSSYDMADITGTHTGFETSPSQEQASAYGIGEDEHSEEEDKENDKKSRWGVLGKAATFIGAGLAGAFFGSPIDEDDIAALGVLIKGTTEGAGAAGGSGAAGGAAGGAGTTAATTSAQ